MNSQGLEKEFHVSRYIIIYKFILGIIEFLLGLGFVFFGKRVFAIYLNFKSQELFEDPHDLLARIAEKTVPYLFEHRGYIVLILISFGLAKIIGAVGLYYGRYWGLDLLVALSIALLPFETYNLISDPTIAKLTYLIINILISLYLVNFRPVKYVSKLKDRVKVGR